MVAGTASIPEGGSTKRRVAVRLVLAPLVLGALLFLPAGTLAYWQAWVYVAVLLVPLGGVAAYFLHRDPAFLERRMKLHEPDATQRKIVQWSVVPYLGTYAIPGLDFRMGWSTVPPWAAILADAFVLLGYLFIVWLFHTNRYAGRTVCVEEHQSVVTTGPYAWVRHPMYLGVTVMMIASPVALGSWWALLPALAVPVILAVRAKAEEDLLTRELPGYDAYVRQTRYRLVPGVW